MAKTGRPKIKASDRKTDFLSLRFTKAEKATLSTKADKAGKPLKDWARDTLLA